ncbi:SCS2 [Candida theae]|uniref:SCS2 n=1 Tax=Candida theae TaxID=1198502 RepID=A0AAD5BIF6_9ASCO|nr:SCS2 [Candida theae]KAI5966029.1 SCS2 [Candida theae]
MNVSPNVLEFTGSFTKQNTEYLTLSNPTNQPLAFKVKTTAPKLYCVRPNASIIHPGDSLQISIILQGFSQPLPEDYKCKDKFLLVSVPAPGNADPAKVGELWSQLEAQNKSAVVSRKLKVNYVIGPDKDDSYNGVGAGAVGAGQQQPPPQQQQQQQQQQPALSHQTSQSSYGAGAAGIAGGAAAGAGAAGLIGNAHYQPQGQANGDASFNNKPSSGDFGGVQNRSFNDTSSINNGYSSGYQQHQQPPHQQLQQQPSYQSQQGGGFNSGYGDQYQQQQQNSPSVQRELDSLARQVQSLTAKLDRNERAASRGDVSSSSSAVDLTANGISLPVALILVLIAFLVGWLVF